MQWRDPSCVGSRVPVLLLLASASSGLVAVTFFFIFFVRRRALIFLILILSILTLSLVISPLTTLATLIRILTLTALALIFVFWIARCLGSVVAHRNSPTRLNAEVKSSCAPWRDGSVPVTCTARSAAHMHN